MSKVKKLDLAFLALKLDEFLFFDNFLDLANFSLFDFWDLNNFPIFKFINFSINLL